MTELFLEKPHDYLLLELSLKKERRPAYSMRAFARDLQMSSSSLADILKGRQGLSEERAREVAKILKWSPERYEHFWNLLQASFSGDPIKKQSAQKLVLQRLAETKNRISLDRFKMMSDWQHLPILTFLQMRATGYRASEVTAALGFTPEVVAESLARLQRLDLVRKDQNLWLATKKNSNTGDEAPSDAVRAFHHQILSQAQEALEKFEMTDRENLSIVYSIEKKYMPKIHREIRDAIYKILTDYSNKSKEDSVQALTLQMFPVSKPSKGEME